MRKRNEKQHANSFWTWFKINKTDFESLDLLSVNKKDDLLNTLLHQLHEFSKGLYFLIHNSGGKNELIITAEGKLEYFDNVEELIESAPKIENWSIIKFKPFVEENFVTQYKDIKVSTKNSWFLPLNNERDISKLGIRVGVPDFDINKKDDFKFAATEMLESVLGELSMAMDVNYIDVVYLPKNPEEDGFIELKDIRDYIKWKKKNR